MAHLITVKVNDANPAMRDKDGNLRIGLWEVHADHPGGEVWVAPDREGNAVPVEVAETPRVLEALRNESIVKVIAEPPKRAAFEAPRRAEIPRREAQVETEDEAKDEAPKRAEIEPPKRVEAEVPKKAEKGG